MKRIYPIVGLLAVCWLMFLVNNLMMQGALSQYGIVPRTERGLLGILFAPFLHSSFQHITANSIPLFVLGSIISVRSPKAFFSVTIFGILFSGLLTWLIARPACHIGASGLVFCYFGYVIGLALYRHKVSDILVALICGVAYGGIIWGLSPFQHGVSWEGHASGLAVGWLMARFSKPSSNEQVAVKTL